MIFIDNSGQITVLPIPPNSYEYLPAVTLTHYGRIMRFDPAIYMGVKVALYTCDPYTPDQREQVYEAINNAYDMMNTWVVNHGRNMHNENLMLESAAPYFDIKDCQPGLLTEQFLTASIVYEISAPLHHRKATLSALVGPLATGQSVYDVEVLGYQFKQRRLGVTQIAPFHYDSVTGVCTLYARAYNFIDVDNIIEGVDADDAVPYLTDVPVRVRILTAANPLAYWRDNTICITPVISQPCTYTSTEGTLVRKRGSVYDVCGYTIPCSCDQLADHYTLNVVKSGIWKSNFQDAVVGLHNCLIDESIYRCNPLSLYRWRDDQGIGEKWDRVYRYSFWNPFGILAPGAQRAWKAIENSMQFCQVTSM